MNNIKITGTGVASESKSYNIPTGQLGPNSTIIVKSGGKILFIGRIAHNRKVLRGRVNIFGKVIKKNLGAL